MTHDLYDHQKIIIEEDKKYIGIFQGTGSGKTRTALELAEGRILIVCLKQQYLDETWQINAKKFGIDKDITVMSKEMFRRDWKELPYFDTLIIDEAHKFFGVEPYTRQRNKVEIPRSSQMFESALNYIKKHNPKRFYPCTATPAAKPMKVWAAGKLLGYNWNYYKFRETFYFSTGGNGRQLWLPERDEYTQQRLALLVQRMGYTGGLEDFVDVPEQTHKEVVVELTTKQKEAIKKVQKEEADPLVQKGRIRTIQNGVLYGKEIKDINEVESKMVKSTMIFPSQKIDYILEKATEFKKILIFAQYTAQIHEIEKALTKEGYTVSTVTGKTKNRGTVFKEAHKDKDHIVIAQSGISEGYELPSFRVIIYASKSWQYDHYKQSLGRLVRANNLYKNLYIHLIVKGADEDCHKSMMAGEDFQERLSPL